MLGSLPTGRLPHRPREPPRPAPAVGTLVSDAAGDVVPASLRGCTSRSGSACIPLLLLKLWAVYPKLWQWPPARNLLHVAERGVALAAGGSARSSSCLTGLQNIFYWYSWPFFFTTVHYWTAWVLAGSVLLHISIKWIEINSGWSSALAGSRPDRQQDVT